MANVKVIIEEVIKGQGNVKKVSADLKDIEKSAAQASRAATTSSTSWTEFNSALSLVRQGAQAVGRALDETSGVTVAYANQVRLLGQINGQTAESNSRLIQTLDDYKISVDDITQASRKLKDQGLTPNLDTIIKLAGEYQKISDPAAKLKFAQDNLGKSSKAWLEVLNQTPEALRKQAAGISANLILSQKQVDAARKLELAEDAKNDAMQGWAVTLGNKIIPLQTDVLNGMNVMTRGFELFYSAENDVASGSLSLADAMNQAGREIYDEQEAMTNLRDAADGTSESMDGLTGSQMTAEEAAKSLSDTYQNLLSSMFAIQSANDSYNDTIQDINKSDEELTVKKFDLILAHEREAAAGRETTASYNEYIAKLREINQSIDENIKKRSDASADLKKQADQRVYDLVAERLGADGIIDSGEYEYLQNLAVQKGLVSQAAADQAIAESRAADDIVSSFDRTNDAMSETLALQARLIENSGSYPFEVPFTGGNLPTPLPSPYNPSPHATGGQFMIPQSYGNEGFRMGNQDTASGGELVTITPKGGDTPGITNNFNINIGSIRSQADLDYLAQEVTRLQASAA